MLRLTAFTLAASLVVLSWWFLEIRQLEDKDSAEVVRSIQLNACLPAPTPGEILDNLDNLLERTLKRYEDLPFNTWPDEARRVWWSTLSARIRFLDDHPELKSRR